MTERVLDADKYLGMLFEAMNQKNLALLEGALAENAVFYFPKTAPIEGKKRIITFLKILLRKYPDLNFTVRRIIGNTASAAAEWSNHGTSSNGDSYQNAGATFLEMKEGKIIYISDTFKNTEIV